MFSCDRRVWVRNFWGIKNGTHGQFLNKGSLCLRSHKFGQRLRDEYGEGERGVGSVEEECLAIQISFKNIILKSA